MVLVNLVNAHSTKMPHHRRALDVKVRGRNNSRAWQTDGQIRLWDSWARAWPCFRLDRETGVSLPWEPCHCQTGWEVAVFWGREHKERWLRKRLGLKLVMDEVQCSPRRRSMTLNCSTICFNKWPETLQCLQHNILDSQLNELLILEIITDNSLICTVADKSITLTKAMFQKTLSMFFSTLCAPYYE